MALYIENKDYERIMSILPHRGEGRGGQREGEAVLQFENAGGT